MEVLRRELSVRPWLCGNVPVRIAARDGEHSGSAAQPRLVGLSASGGVGERRGGGSGRRTGEVVVGEEGALGADARVEVVHVAHPHRRVVAVEQRILVVLPPPAAAALSEGGAGQGEWGGWGCAP